MTVSLKVLAPAVLGVVTGLVLVVTGTAAHDGELRTIGLSTIATSLALAGVGYRVPHTPAPKSRRR